MIFTFSHLTIQKHHLPYMKIESSLIWGYHTHLCIFLRKDQHKIPYGSIFSHYSTDSNVSVFLLPSSIVHKEKKSSKAGISIFIDCYKCKILPFKMIQLSSKLLSNVLSIHYYHVQIYKITADKINLSGMKSILKYHIRILFHSFIINYTPSF